MANSGLGEVEHFLKKAEQQIGYAVMALENSEIDGAVKKVDGIGQKIELLLEGLEDLRFSIEHAEEKLAELAEEAESKEPEE